MIFYCWLKAGGIVVFLVNVGLVITFQYMWKLC